MVVMGLIIDDGVGHHGVLLLDRLNRGIGGLTIDVYIGIKEGKVG